MAEQTKERVFKIGSTLIPEDPSVVGLSNEEVRDTLKMAFPEVSHAKITEVHQGDKVIVEFAAQAGRKG